MKRPRPKLALIVVGALILVSCKRSEDLREDTPLWVKLPQAPVAKFVPGAERIVAQAVVGPTGGILRGIAGTPVQSIIVSVPPGAFEKPTTLSLGYNTGTFNNVSQDELGGAVIVLRSGGSSVFHRPVTVSFPLKDPSRIPIPYYIHEDGMLELMAPQPVDTAAGRGSFITWHASNYTFTHTDPKTKWKPVWNGFDPKKDGFAVRNDSGDYTPKARCWGMSNFAKWYKEHVDDGLIKQFLEKVPTNTGNKQINTFKAQDLIATRAHNSVTLGGSSLVIENNRIFLTAVRDALSKGAKAVAVGMVNAPHVVLAIGFTDNQIAVYDPNHPYLWKAMDYELEPPVAEYGDYAGFTVWGGEMALNEEYARILADARAQFHGENLTKIEVTSHHPNQEVSSEDVSLEGKVHSGQVLISEIEARVMHEDGSESGSVKLPMPPDDNTFKLPLQLKQGINVITFITRGQVYSKGLMVIPNYPLSFTLRLKKLQLPKSRLEVTTTRIDRSTSERIVRTESFSTNLVYDTYSHILSQGWDFGRCDNWSAVCDLVQAASFNSMKFSEENRLPVNIEYHLKIYRIDNRGKEELMQYQDGAGTLKCQSAHLRIFVAPGASKFSHKYRVNLKTSGHCESNSLVKTKYRIQPGSDKWNDKQDDLNLLMVTPYGLQIDSANPLPCEKPAEIQAGNIEPWAADQRGVGSWMLTSGIQGCDYNGTKRDETTSIKLNLVP